MSSHRSPWFEEASTELGLEQYSMRGPLSLLLLLVHGNLRRTLFIEPCDFCEGRVVLLGGGIVFVLCVS